MTKTKVSNMAGTQIPLHPGMRVCVVYLSLVVGFGATVVALIYFFKLHFFWGVGVLIVLFSLSHYIALRLYKKRGLAITPMRKPSVWIEENRLTLERKGSMVTKKLSDVKAAKMHFRYSFYCLRGIDDNLELKFGDGSTIFLQGSYLGFGDVWSWLKDQDIEIRKIVIP